VRKVTPPPERRTKKFKPDLEVNSQKPVSEYVGSKQAAKGAMRMSAITGVEESSKFKNRRVSSSKARGNSLTL